MSTVKPLIAILLAFLMLSPLISAVPTNGASTLVSNNNFTLDCTGAVGDTWVRWGDASGDYLTYKTANVTADAGVAEITVVGNMLAGTEYDWTFCDSTGCDATSHSVTTSALVPNPTSTLSAPLETLKESSFNVLILGQVMIEPYLWLFGTSGRDMGVTVISFLLFLAIYVGMWLRTRSVATAAIAGVILAPVLLYTDAGLKLGLPPEAQAIAQALFYASMAGLALSVLKK